MSGFILICPNVAEFSKDCQAAVYPSIYMVLGKHTLKQWCGIPWKNLVQGNLPWK